jgi:hypothetical protein
MANTPFELYEEAYRLHYREKKISDAVKIYEAVMREFPDSSECGYAFIQLQKIKANEVTTCLQAGGSGWDFPTLVAVFVGCAALLVSVAGTLIAFHELKAEHNRTDYAVVTLAELQAGNTEAADKNLVEMKKLYPNDVLARELSTCVAAGGVVAPRRADPVTMEPDSSARVSPAPAPARTAKAQRAQPPRVGAHTPSPDAGPADSSGH